MVKKKPVQILLLDNSPADARLIKKTFQACDNLTVNVTHLKSLKEGLEKIRSNTTDIVFLDLYLDGARGLGLFTTLHESFPQIPVVVLSSYEDDTFALEALRRGAQDYLIKEQVNERMLGRVVKHAIERKKTHEQLIDSEQKYKELFENIWAGVAHMNPQGKLLFVSDRMAQMFGLKKKDMLGRSFWRYVLPSEKKKVKDYFAQSYAKGSCAGAPLEFRCRRDKGGVFICELRARVLVKDGAMPDFQLMIHDITEQRLAQAAMRESQERIKILVENVPDFVLMTDKEGTIQYLNRSKDGFPPVKELIGQNITSLLLPSDHRRCLKEIRSVIRTGEIVKAEYIDILGAFYVTRCLPVKHQGKAIGALIIAHESSDAKRALKLARFHEEFRNVIMQISASFINLSWQETDKSINRALAVVGKLMGVDRAYVFLSHDNNTKATNTHEWYARGIKPQKKRFRGIPVEAFPWVADQILSKKNVVIEKMDEFPPQAARERKRLEADGTKSILNIPMVYSGRLIGFVGLDTAKKERSWSQDTIALMRILGDIFAQALQKKKSEERLRSFNACLVSLGADPQENINRLVGLCGELLKGNFAFFNRIAEENLHVAAGWKTPKKLNKKDKAQGHICYELLANEKQQTVHLRSLQESIFVQTDPFIRQEKIESYLGTAVRQGEAFLGTLCVLFKEDYETSQDDKNLIELIAAAVAIEEQRRAILNKLRDNQATLRQVIDLSPNFIFAKDEKGKFLLVNQAVAKAYGAHPRDIIGKTDGDFNKNKEEVEHFLKDDLAVMRSGRKKIVPIEEITHASGEKHYLQTTKIPFKVVGTKASAVLGVSVDVTSFREAQKKLVLEHAQLLSIFDSINEIIYVSDPQTYEILYVNKFFRKAMNKKLIGGLCYKEFQGFERPCDFCTNKIILKNRGRPYQWEYRNPVLSRDYMIVDRLIKWPDGRDVRFEVAIDVTKQKQAEKAMKEAEVKLKTFVDSSQNWETFRNNDGKLIYVSPAFERITGYRMEDYLSGKVELKDIVHPQDLERHDKMFREYLAGEKVSDYELRMIRKDGQVIDVSISGETVRDKKGEMIGRRATCIDVTERKKTETALKESEARLRTAMESLPFDFFVIDKSGRYVMQNAACRKNWGDIIGKKPCETAADKDTLAIWEDNNRRAFTGETVKGEVTLKKDNKETYAFNIIAPINAKGEVQGVLGVNIDITDQRKAEEALKKNEALLRTVFDTIPLWVFVKDRDEKILMVNKRMADDFGVAPRDFINRRTERTPAAAAEDKAFYVYVDHTVLETGKRQDITQEPFTRPDGQVRFLHTMKVPFKDKDGKIIGIVGVAEDITERKKQETELEGYRQHLEELVDERTRELRQSERLAATGRLAASFAHEINNPLQGITTHLEILREAFPKHFKKIKNYEEVRANMGRIKTIVAKLLDMCRPLEEHKGALNINDILEETVSFLTHQLKMKTIELQLNLAKELPKIEGWREQLQQVFLNILLNAQDSIREGGVISVRSFTEEGDVCVSIEDTGEGIPKENLVHIFDPFFTTKKEAGTGLGLFICQGIIKEHGGDIKVKSEAGRGSTFTVELPSFIKGPASENLPGVSIEDDKK